MLLWWDRATWVIPMLGVVIGIVLANLIGAVDEAASQLTNGESFVSPTAATTILASVGGGMITFTGFVFSFVLLIVQFGSTAYSPRTVSYFLRSRAVRRILALFLTTVTFAFLSLAEVGSSGRADFAPTVAVGITLLLLISSLLGFVTLLHSVGGRIRVDAVLASIGRSAREQFGGSSGRRWKGWVEPDSPPVGASDDEVLADYLGSPGQVVGIDTRALRRLARRHGCAIEIIPRVGDAIVAGTPVARVGAARSSLDRAISNAVVVDVERSLVHDAIYGLRLLVDVAARALSPGVNDPTTAVRALNEIEGVLRAAESSGLLGTRTLRVRSGSLTLNLLTWDELVDLALLEILEYGFGQVQIHRRLIALLDDLVADVSAPHQAVLLAYRDELRADLPLTTQRAKDVVRTGDRQGLGGSH
jgi:uncharacterized membrane protein